MQSSDDAADHSEQASQAASKAIAELPPNWSESPDDPALPLLRQRGLVVYGYDLAQAARLLNDAGWSKGPDGIYQMDGQRFAMDVSAQNRASFQ